ALTGVVEYVIGFVGIRLLGMRLWDYRGLFLNLDGIICFRSVVSFGVMGMLFHYLVEPAALRAVRKIAAKAVYAFCLLLMLLFLTDCLLSALFRTPITY
ncbi:MAG: putative ABC transporter permease, partial [Eubacteriales bacterium]